MNNKNIYLMFLLLLSLFNVKPVFAVTPNGQCYNLVTLATKACSLVPLSCASITAYNCGLVTYDGSPSSGSCSATASCVARGGKNGSWVCCYPQAMDCIANCSSGWSNIGCPDSSYCQSGTVTCTACTNAKTCCFPVCASPRHLSGGSPPAGYYQSNCLTGNTCSGTRTCCLWSQNGSCGGSHDTCSAGTYNVNPADTYDANSVRLAWNWTCYGIDGGSTANCSTPSPINGSCGGSHDTCTAGTYSVNPADSYDVNGDRIAWLWTCSGTGGGSTANCSQNVVYCSCGTTSSKCGTYTVTGACETKTCTGTAAIGSCQKCDASNNVVTDPVKVIAGGWSAWGTCSPSCGTGSQSRTCNNPSPACGGATCVGSATQSCSLGCCPSSGVNGVCGSANGVTTNTPPTANLCNVGGNAGVTTNSNSYSWTCFGTAGVCGGSSGSDVLCVAPSVLPPTYTGVKLNNNSNVEVLAESGNINQTCDIAFSSRLVKYLVTASDPNGNSDIASVLLRVGGVTYTNNYASNFTGTATFSVSYATVPSTLTSAIETNITDNSGLSTGWLNTGRTIKIWDCKVPVTGSLFNGSNAVFETINCANGSQDFASKVGSSMAYGLTFTGIAVDTDKSMTVSSPDYSSGANNLYWGAQYRASFTNVDGNTPIMRYPGNNTCNNSNASFTLDKSAQINVDPYSASPTLRIDFSSILNQFPWFQTSGGGVVAKNSIVDNIPNTCVSPCRPNISLSEGTSAPNGLVAAQSINTGSGSYGETNNWNVNKNIIGIDYSYKFFYNEYFVKLAQGKAYDVGTGSINFSQIVTDTGGTGVVFVKGNVNIDANNSVPSGRFLMLIVSNDINVSSAVINIQGIFITENSFTVGGTSANKLIIDGSIYSRNVVSLSRGYITGTLNNRNPAILVNFRPDFIFSMPGKLTKILSGWQEGI